MVGAAFGRPAPMGIDGWITVGVIAVLMAVLVRGRIGPDTAMLGALA